jgi:hypothetical protein
MPADTPQGPPRGPAAPGSGGYGEAGRAPLGAGFAGAPGGGGGGGIGYGASLMGAMRPGACVWVRTGAATACVFARPRNCGGGLAPPL